MRYDLLGEITKARLPYRIYSDHQSLALRGVYGIIYCLTRRHPKSYLLIMQYANMHPFDFKRMIGNLERAGLIRGVGAAIQIIDQGDKVDHYPVPSDYIHENFLMDKEVDIRLKGLYLTLIARMDDKYVFRRSQIDKICNANNLDPNAYYKSLLRYGLFKKIDKGQVQALKKNEFVYQKDLSVDMRYVYNSLLDGLANAVIYRDVESDNSRYLKVNYYYRLRWKFNDNTTVYERSIFRFSLMLSSAKETCTVHYANLNRDTSKDDNWVDDFFKLYPDLNSDALRRKFLDIIDTQQFKLLMAEKDIKHEKFVLT